MKLTTTAISLLAVCIFPTVSAPAQTTPAPGEVCSAGSIKECPESGCGGWDRELSAKKNLSVEPAGPAEARTLEEIRAMPYPSMRSGGKDRKEIASLGEGKLVTVEAAAFKVEYGEAEFSNCRLSGKRDMNLRLSLITREEARVFRSSGEREARAVIAVLTPRVRLDHPKWTKKRLADLIDRVPTDVVAVRITGVLLLDTEPPSVPSPGYTYWVIHPVFKIDVCSRGCDEQSGWEPLDTAWVTVRKGGARPSDGDEPPIAIAPEENRPMRRRFVRRGKRGRGH